MPPEVPRGVLGGGILLSLVPLALLAPLLAPFDPYAVHVLHKYAAPGSVLAETGQHFWLGAERLTPRPRIAVEATSQCRADSAETK